MEESIETRIEMFITGVMELPEPPVRTLDTVTSVLNDYREEKKIRIAVVGEFSAGKSAFINSLFKRRFLPMGITPTTSVLHYIQYAEDESVVIHYRDGGQETVTVDTYGENGKGIKVRADDEDKAIEKVDVFVREPLARGFLFIDTPGLEDPDCNEYHTISRLLPMTDILIFVLNSGRLLSMKEKTYIADNLFKSALQKILFVVNKIDLLDQEGDKKTVIQKVKFFAGTLTAQSVPVMHYSAKKILDYFHHNDTTENPENALDGFGYTQVRTCIKNWKSNRRRLKEECYRNRLIYMLQQLTVYYDTRCCQAEKEARQLVIDRQNLEKEINDARDEVDFILNNLKIKIDIFFKQYENDFLKEFDRFKKKIKEKVYQIRPQDVQLNRFLDNTTGDKNEDKTVWNKVIFDIQTDLKDIIDTQSALFENRLKDLLLEETRKPFPNVPITPERLIKQETLDLLFSKTGCQQTGTSWTRFAQAATLGGMYISGTGNYLLGGSLVIGGYLFNSIDNKIKHEQDLSLLYQELADIVDKVRENFRRAVAVKQKEFFPTMKERLEEAVNAQYTDTLNEITAEKKNPRTAGGNENREKHWMQVYKEMKEKLNKILFNLASQQDSRHVNHCRNR